jgi:5-methylcytosine-specific restriction endonuclease McrA
MKFGLTIFIITVFFIANVYHDGKYVQLLKSWKKYYQMISIGFVGLSAYLFIRKNPNESRNLLTHANGLIKYMPIDKEAGDLLTPFLNMYAPQKPFFADPLEQRILNSGRGNSPTTGTATTMTTTTKRSVSETKKKYVAAQQGWNCGSCKKQLPAWFEVDHKIRLDNGGSNHVDNLVALCRDCHGKKTAFENL